MASSRVFGFYRDGIACVMACACRLGYRDIPRNLGRDYTMVKWYNRYAADWLAALVLLLFLVTLAISLPN